MKNYKNATAAITIILLAAALMFAALSQTTVNAQQTSDAIVIIQPAQGGTTDPGPGNYTYPNGTNIMLTATASPGYRFLYWIASGDLTPGHTQGQSTVIIDPDTGEVIGFVPRPIATGIDSLVFATNPAVITCGYGYTYTYQPVFEPTGTTGGTGTPTATSATVIVLPSSDGRTTPANGTYYYENGTNISIEAIPNEGMAFHYWVISGNLTPGHIQQTASIIADPDTGQIIATFPRVSATGVDSLVTTSNPLDITCGYGYTYAYQAVFTPATGTDHSPSPGVTGSPTTSPQVTASPAITTSPSPQVTATATPVGTIVPGIDDWILIAIVVIVIIIIIVAIAAAMRRK